MLRLHNPIKSWNIFLVMNKTITNNVFKLNLRNQSLQIENTETLLVTECNLTTVYAPPVMHLAYGEIEMEQCAGRLDWLLL